MSNLVSLVIGVVALVLAAVAFLPLLGWANWFILPLAVIGAAALIILLVRPGAFLAGRIAAAGRTAFSNYLGTSIQMTTLFYGYGFGLFGSLSRAQLYIVVLGVWALILLWSKPWLQRYRYGPLEWLWRTLSRGEAQPMRLARSPGGVAA